MLTRRLCPMAFAAIVAIVATRTARAFSLAPGRLRDGRSKLPQLSASTISSSASSPLLGGGQLGPRLPINDGFPGIEMVHSDPDVFIIRNFLDDASCDDLIAKASDKKLEQSPVAYAGWTKDFKDLTELAAKGPAAWAAVLLAWWQVHQQGGGSQLDLIIHAAQNYAVCLGLAVAGIAVFTKSRTNNLQTLRTSTSTTLDDLYDASSGTTKFVERSAALFRTESNVDLPLRREAAYFEAPTVIRYEAGQVLAPHFDANRSANTEDANRGGQTLATLLVYLNNVTTGGRTRFGLLSAKDGDDKLIIQPRKGDALLFFPADASGRFDGRTEHEGCAAVDEKWIARIWRHQSRVPPPFGLTESALSKLPETTDL